MNDLLLHQKLADAIQNFGPPEGYEPIRVAYIVPPDSISANPALCVLPASDAITYGAANRVTTIRAAARIYLRPTSDNTRRFTTLMAWRSRLRDAVLSDFTLGGNCDLARVTETRIDNEDYGGEPFIYAEATVEITKAEHVSIS